MRRLALIFVLLAFSLQAVASPPPDVVPHVVASGLGVLVLSSLLGVYGLNKKQAVVLSVVGMFGIGFIKERFIDPGFTGRDMKSNTLGILLGSGFVLCL